LHFAWRSVGPLTLKGTAIIFDLQRGFFYLRVGRRESIKIKNL
jgi:hypothetical protein